MGACPEGICGLLDQIVFFGLAARGAELVGHAIQLQSAGQLSGQSGDGCGVGAFQHQAAPDFPAIRLAVSVPFVAGVDAIGIGLDGRCLPGFFQGLVDGLDDLGVEGFDGFAPAFLDELHAHLVVGELLTDAGFQVDAGASRPGAGAAGRQQAGQQAGGVSQA